MACTGTVTADHIRQLARTIASFHAAAPTSGALAVVATAGDIAARWRETLDEMRQFSGSVLEPSMLDDITGLAERYTAGRASLFDRRIRADKIRDGHGDLLADDIFLLDDGPRVLDCLEFDERLRHGDVLADVAFLAMDLERLGRPDLARQFLDDYRELSGETWPASLAHHYIASRAAIRAKVACLRHVQADPSGQSAEQARLLAGMCLDHLAAGAVRLVLVGGLPGTGKTTLAAALAAEFDAVHLSSDETRKQLAGLPIDQPAGAEWQAGLYTRGATASTYRVMLEEAEQALRLGQSVVLDGSWSGRAMRAAAAAIAATTTADLVQLRCVVPSDVAAARIATRAATGGSASDATAAVAARIALAFDPWPEATTIDTTQPEQAAVKSASHTANAVKMVG